MQVTGGSVQTGGAAAVEGDEGASSDGKESSPDSLQVKDSSHDDKEDLESRLARKRKAVSPKPVPAPRDIRLRLRSASGQKAPPAMKATSELPPIGVKGSLSKHLRSSSFVSEPLLSSVVRTPETARDFLSHAVPPSHRFMNSALRDDLFGDQYSMSLCEGFFRGVGLLQRVDDLRKENEGLKSDLKTSQSVAGELR
ncbi:hypothetical protein Hdeb2414_s0016g00496981 [Helianthus debilis subsp. tardiflorus]